MNIEDLTYQVIALGEALMFEDKKRKEESALGATARGAAGGGLIGYNAGLLREGNKFDKKTNRVIENLRTSSQHGRQSAREARIGAVKRITGGYDAAHKALTGGKLSAEEAGHLKRLGRMVGHHVVAPALKKYAVPGAVVGGAAMYTANKIGKARRKKQNG